MGGQTDFRLRWVFAWVAFEPYVWVHEVAFPLVGNYTGSPTDFGVENGEPYRPDDFDTLYNAVPANGPVGTIVRFKIYVGEGDEDRASNPCVWWMGPKTGQHY